MKGEGRHGMRGGFMDFFSNTTLKSKFLISITLLIILITAAILFATNRVISENMMQNKKHKANYAVANLKNLLEGRRKTLERYAQLAGENADLLRALNGALLHKTYEEISKECRSLQELIDCERIILCRAGDPRCEIITDTTGEQRQDDLISVNQLCQESAIKGTASDLCVEEGAFKIKACSPIGSRGNAIAYLILDDTIDSDVTRLIESSTGAKTSLLLHNGAASARIVTSSSQNLIGREIAGGAFSQMLAKRETTYQTDFMDGDQAHMALFKPMLNQHGEMLGSVMILIPMDDVMRIKSSMVKAMSSISLIAIALGLLIFLLIVRGVVTPLHKLLFVAQAMGEGDLTRKIEIRGSDEIGLLSSAFQQVQDKLHAMVTQIKGGIELLESSSVELSNSSRQQADGSMHQSSALTETSTTVEELAATSKQIAENAKMVAELAHQSLAGMEAIRNNTDQEATRILTLGEKSQTIGEVVAMIDDIAKQTNILALNASIEAERAGEAGKGFAVVAIEIRELAKNVAKSTRQIREIIKEIQDATNASVMATENVGKSVMEGIDLSKRTAESANQISLATQQQGSATSEVVTAIKQMHDIVGQTTAGANQIADTSHQLVELTAQQKKLVEQFTIH